MALSRIPKWRISDYPGYSVWLNAAVADTNDISWQWYEVGHGAIPGATNSSYIPTNAGTAGVAGQYYAIASDDIGSAITTTAAVSFVSAPLPPGWTSASKSPFEPEDESRATNGVWASGWCESGYYPQIEYTEFGTNRVYSDAQFVSGGAGGSRSIVWYPAGVLANIADASTPSPVSLINPVNNGANFQFQFLSESSFNYNILYRTNLLVGNWQTNSTVSGDGTLKTVSIPMSVFSPSQQGFVRVTAQ